MIFIVVAIVAVVLWFYFVRQRGRSFLREVSYCSELYLKDQGEAVEAIQKYFHSAQFKSLATTNIGTTIFSWGRDRDQLVFETAARAENDYMKQPEFWRRTLTGTAAQK